MARQMLDGRVVVSDWNEEASQPMAMGHARRLVQDAPVAVNLVTIGPEADRHYHRFTTEIYICMSGKGRLVCDGESIELRPGVAVTVKPGVVHQPFADGELECLIVVSPPFGNPADRVATDRQKLFANLA